MTLGLVMLHWVCEPYKASKADLELQLKKSCDLLQDLIMGLNARKSVFGGFAHSRSMISALNVIRLLYWKVSLSRLAKSGISIF